MRAHPVRAAALAGLAVLLVAWGAWRAHSGTSDLVTGYLGPTRAIVFGDADPLKDFPFNSFAPFFYCVLAPFAALPDTLASVAWSTLMLAQLYGIARWLLALVGSARAVWLALGLDLFLVANNIGLGQSNLFSLFFVVGAVHALSQQRDARAGLWLSVAVAFKITPALFIGWLLLKRRWRALGGVAVGLALWLVVVPSAVLGPARNAAMLREWGERVVGPYLSGQKVQTTNIHWHHTNQSLEAFVQRHFTPYGRTEYGGGHQWVDPALLTEAQAARVALGLRLLVLAALVAASWRLKAREGAALVLEVGLWLLGALFLSPASWISHYVALLVAFAAAAAAWPARRWLLGAAAVAAAGSWLCAGRQAESYSPLFLGALLFFVALLAAAWRTADASPVPVGESPRR